MGIASRLRHTVTIERATDVLDGDGNVVEDDHRNSSREHGGVTFQAHGVVPSDENGGAAFIASGRSPKSVGSAIPRVKQGRP